MMKSLTQSNRQQSMKKFLIAPVIYFFSTPVLSHDFLYHTEHNLMSALGEEPYFNVVSEAPIHIDQSKILNLYHKELIKDAKYQLIALPGPSQLRPPGNPNDPNKISIADCDDPTAKMAWGICGGEFHAPSSKAIDDFTKARIAANRKCEELALSGSSVYEKPLIPRFIGPESFVLYNDDFPQGAAPEDHHDGYSLDEGLTFECGFLVSTIAES